MYKVTLSMIFMGLLGAYGQQSTDHCALLVVVRTSEDLEPETRVRVITSYGRTLERENEAGGVRFCELGSKPVTILVGNACNVVTINNVELVWGQTRRVRVIYDPCKRHDPPPSPTPGCEIVLFVWGNDGSPLPGAAVQIESPIEHDYTSDLFGRVLLTFRFGATIRGTVSKPGFRAEQLALDCTRQQPTIETEMKLLRVK